MLYKKYHRSYVRQFKKGFRFIIYGEVEVSVLAEPHICCSESHPSNKTYHWVEVIVSEDGLITRRLILIDENGREPRIR